VPSDHPPRAVRDILKTAFKGMNRVFDGMRAKSGRDSIALDRLLRTLTLRMLYGISSERMYGGLSRQAQWHQVIHTSEGASRRPRSLAI